MDLLEPLRTPFLDRVRATRPTRAVAFLMDRRALALALAAAPGLAVLVAAAWGPPELAKAITSTTNTHDLFARLLTAVATASAIAVSVATFTFQREARGVANHQEHLSSNVEYRDRVRDASGHGRLPLPLAAFLAAACVSIRDAVRRVREAAGARGLAVRQVGVALGDYLDAVEGNARVAEDALARAGGTPERVLGAGLALEQEVSHHLARVFGRDESLPREARDALDDLRARIGDAVVGVQYAKTLDMQYGLSRMSTAILVSTFPSIVASAAMVLAYGDGAVDAWGVVGAAAVVGLALAVALLPFGFFVSYVLRFVFVNEHTLPTGGFVLGPELPDVADADGAPARDRKAGA